MDKYTKDRIDRFVDIVVREAAKTRKYLKKEDFEEAELSAEEIVFYGQQLLMTAREG